MKYASLAIHGGRREDAEIKGVNYPLYLSSTFVQDSIGDYGEFVYSRSNNPTRNNVEQLIAQLEEAKYGLAMASGMGATALAFSLLKPGDKVLVKVWGGFIFMVLVLVIVMTFFERIKNRMLKWTIN